MENKSKSRKTTKEMDLKDLYILSFYFTGYDFIVTKQKKWFYKNTCQIMIRATEVQQSDSATRGHY